MRAQSHNDKNGDYEDGDDDRLKLIIRASLLAQLPVDHKEIVENFYQLALRMEDQVGSGSLATEGCRVCGHVAFKCSCLSEFYAVNSKLSMLNMFDQFVGQILTATIYGFIETHISKTCKEYNVSYLEPLQKWLDDVVMRWVEKIYSSYKLNAMTNEAVQKMTMKLRNFLNERFTLLRIKQLFNIIVEYPESIPALTDLRTSLARTDLQAMLTSSLRRAMETRLLHPGVGTSDILTAYVAAIRSMRVLDSTGLLLETVTQPVHQYLRSREDTIRCVVSSLTDESFCDLSEELTKGDGINDHGQDEDDGDAWITWTPDPVELDSKKPAASETRRTGDIISMLVNVYGSKELFVNEYRTLLADRLLPSANGAGSVIDVEREIRYLELLKLRFGDGQLHNCEVMLKDVDDSRRIGKNIHLDPNYTEDVFPMQAMMISAQFWPSFKEEQLHLHDSVEEQFKKYTKAFEVLKGNRTLCWKRHLGVVDLDIELQTTDGVRKLELSVSPIHATIIMHFADQSQWYLEYLSGVMHTPCTVLKRKIAFWQSYGILVERKPNLFVVAEGYYEPTNEHDMNSAGALSSHLGQTEQTVVPSIPETVQEIIVVEEEAESAMTSTQDQREEELQTFWSYVIGMLTNLDSLPLERIHQMLKMFAFQGPTIECSMQELRQFLDRKVREHQLLYSGGSYRLPKSS